MANIVRVGRDITADISADIITWCRENLTIENPEWHKKVQMGKWVGNTPKEILLYERIGDTIHMPFGCLKRLYDSLKDAHFVADFGLKHGAKYQSNINLYSYQQRALEAIIKRKNGIVVIPCGGGKTQTALAAIEKLGVRCLWLTHTQDLLNQSRSRAFSVLTTSESYGAITAGKVSIGTGITFATVQTMAKLDLRRYADCWDMVVVDECQHCCGSPTRVTQFYKVLSNINCRYKIGLTATPKRADGLEKAMFALLGDVICEIPKSDVSGTTCPFYVETVETGYMPDMDAALCGDGTINYTGLVADLIKDDFRFKVVLNRIDSLDGSAIVLANRVEYLQRLSERCHKKNICISGVGNSKSAKIERENALSALQSGDVDIVFATYQLAKEGLDVPNLRYVVFATPEKDETTVVQSVGRVCRKAEGKEYGMVIDFVDNFGMYKGWAKKRKNFYKKLGAEKFI